MGLGPGDPIERIGDGDPIERVGDEDVGVMRVVKNVWGINITVGPILVYLAENLTVVKFTAHLQGPLERVLGLRTVKFSSNDPFSRTVGDALTNRSRVKFNHSYNYRGGGHNFVECG